MRIVAELFVTEDFNVVCARRSFSCSHISKTQHINSIKVLRTREMLSTLTLEQDSKYFTAAWIAQACLTVVLSDEEWFLVARDDSKISVP
jgi:hypothetical protein